MSEITGTKNFQNEIRSISLARAKYLYKVKKNKVSIVVALDDMIVGKWNLFHL